MKKYIITTILSCSLAFAMSGIANAANQHHKHHKHHGHHYHRHLPKQVKGANGPDYMNIRGSVNNFSAFTKIYLDGSTMRGFPGSLSAGYSRDYEIAIPVNRDYWSGEADYIGDDNYSGCHIKIEATFDDNGTNLDIETMPLDDYSDCYMQGTSFMMDVQPDY